MTGGRIGADGIHGATFSSAALDESAPVQAVQIGDPITQKLMFDFLLEARDRGLYHAITDNGAGWALLVRRRDGRGCRGRATRPGAGAAEVRGPRPVGDPVSEAQERMTLAVPADKILERLELAWRREVEATDLGEFTDDGYFHVTYGDRDGGAARDGASSTTGSEMKLDARWEPPEHDEAAGAAAGGSGGATLAGDARPAQPLLGRGQGAALRPRGQGADIGDQALRRRAARTSRPRRPSSSAGHDGSTARLRAQSEGVNPFYSDIDTEAMAMRVVDEAVRRQLCAGARLDRIALLDNFCWPDPGRSPNTRAGRRLQAGATRARLPRAVRDHARLRHAADLGQGLDEERRRRWAA